MSTPAPEQSNPDQVVLPFIWRKHWNETQSYAPYSNMLHDLNDQEVMQLSGFKKQFEELGVEDGETIEITIRRTRTKPFPDKVWKLTQPHTYSQVQVPQEERG